VRLAQFERVTHSRQSRDGYGRAMSLMGPFKCIYSSSLEKSCQMHEEKKDSFFRTTKAASSS
jgi:hypothetical protein